uniref:Uncharacterized protein n=1 Tax=Solanum lycopersicum TaxID=4081 RepID=A0A3Q7HY69_SOLLC
MEILSEMTGCEILKKKKEKEDFDSNHSKLSYRAVQIPERGCSWEEQNYKLLAGTLTYAFC